MYFFFLPSNKVFIARNRSNRKSYGRRVSQTARWRRVRKATFDTVCHDSIISYLVSLYQMLSSAKPNWFAAEMKGWQTAIHHRFCRHVCICMRHQNVCASVCVCWAWGAAKWKANKQLQSGAESSATGWPCSRACTYVTRVYRCVRVQTCACADRCGRAEGSATGLKDDVNQRAILIWL